MRFGLNHTLTDFVQMLDDARVVFEERTSGIRNCFIKACFV